MAEGTLLRSPATHEFTAAKAFTSGEVVQLIDGRAGVYNGLNAAAIGDQVSVAVEGEYTLAKTASVVMLEGQRVYWVKSTGKANYTGDFYIGLVVADAAAAATTVRVRINEHPPHDVDVMKNWMDDVALLGLGVTRVGDQVQLAFDAVAEVAAAHALSGISVPVASGMILDFEMAIFDIGDDGALDINVGLANATHASDCDSITESVFIHLDGSALSILAESDDGTTEVAATDTTVDAVDDTWFRVQIDARTTTDIQIYINGVNVLPASVFKLNAATGPMKFLAHIEKTSNDTTADVRVRRVTLQPGSVI
ncbi:MAG: DUF2190 family protein [Phycisphaerales bacterium]|nr:MAG: DUF2190 family protein [Phycisphaerales bacterium]